MASFPAFCPDCGLIFPSAMVFDPDTKVTGVTIANSTEQCPRCGDMADLPDGTFNIVDETIHVLAASRLSREKLLRLSTLLEQARRGDVSPAVAADAIEREAPSLRPLTRHLAPRMRKAFIVFLWAVVQVLLAQGISELRNDSATQKDVREAVEQAIHYCQQHGC